MNTRRGINAWIEPKLISQQLTKALSRQEKLYSEVWHNITNFILNKAGKVLLVGNYLYNLFINGNETIMDSGFISNEVWK